MDTRSVTFTAESGLVEIAVPVGPAGEDHVEAEHHQFIVEHWQGLAAASYQGFRRFGIGAVVIGEPDAPAEALNHPLAAHEVRYVAQDSPWLTSTLDEAISEWLEEQFQIYEPQEAGLFVFLRQGVQPRAYRASGTLPPPQALKQVKAQLN